MLAGHCAAFLHRVTPVWHTAEEEHSAVQCNAVCISVLCNIIRFKKIQDPRLKSLTSLPGTHSRTYFLKKPNAAWQPGSYCGEHLSCVDNNWVWGGVTVVSL